MLFNTPGYNSQPKQSLLLVQASNLDEAAWVAAGKENLSAASGPRVLYN
jgi:hypothetical protein